LRQCAKNYKRLAMGSNQNPKTSETGVASIMINDAYVKVPLASLKRVEVEDFRIYYNPYVIRLHRQNGMPVFTVYDESDNPIERKVMYNTIFEDVMKFKALLLQKA